MARTNAELADELEVVASWLSGGRASKVSSLVAELRGEQPPAPTPQETRDAERAERAQQAAAEAERAAKAAEQQKVDTPP